MCATMMSHILAISVVELESEKGVSTSCVLLEVDTWSGVTSSAASDLLNACTTTVAFAGHPSTGIWAATGRQRRTSPYL
jgi:hypothetical protein